MKREQAQKRIDRLRREIERHDHLYYALDQPAISDEAYDRLFKELRQLEESHPDLLTADSPTQRVAGQPLEKFPTIEHAAPMLSLDSDREEAAVRRFDERLKKALGVEGVAYVLEPKLDGASVELVYEKGVLARASTRGDGTRGEGITANIRTIPSVPLRLRTVERKAPPFLAVRGEVIMPLAEFERLNDRLEREGKETFANPRNAAAGALRQLDPRITASRPLAIYIYDVLAARGLELATQWEGLEALRQWGLRTNDLVRRGANVEDILAYHREIAERRDDLGYEVDGIVIKLDDLAAREGLGWTAHHPRWAFAFKFPPRKEITRVVAIVPSVGRTGVVTPIAMLLPVEIGGTTVAKASLHNREEVARKDIRAGDRVRVQRAGDVIPQIVERIDEPGHPRGPVFRMPESCPSCATPLIERGPFTVCPNGFGCAAQLAGRIVHFASRDALDIEGLGDETAKQLVGEGLVHDLPDLFALRLERLVELEGFATKSAQSLVAAIERARKAELRRLLYGLGIPEVGESVAADLARHFGSFAGLRAASDEDLEAVRGVGPKMAAQITTFFGEPRNRKILDRLLEEMALMETAGAPAGALTGLKFVFTGSLEGFGRREAKELVEAQGARVVSSVSKETDYVVAGADPGSKLDDAKRLGVKVLDERGLAKLLREKGIALKASITP